MSNRFLFTIGEEHIGRAFIKIGDRTYSTSSWIGRILPGDVGKKVYESDGILQVENDQQRDERIAKEALVSDAEMSLASKYGNEVTFELRLRCENEAFVPDPRLEVARILRKLADDLEDSTTWEYHHYRTVLDVNGNDVGRVRLGDQP